MAGLRSLSIPSAFVFSVSLCLCGSTSSSLSAALDPELRTPYELHIVLHLSEHRILTDPFRDRLERELRDSLQEALGELARVKVLFAHEKLAKVLELGLQKALDDWKARSPVKTHFVEIDYIGDNYEIRARQHDGLTGLSSPVVRVDRTRDRDFVAKAAALLVAQDFGLIGTVQLPAKPNEVKVDLKGAGLASLVPWVKVGDIFQLVAISAPDGPGRPVPWTVLQVQRAPTPESSECVCQLFRSNKEPLTSAGVQGYRCVKIATGRFPVRIRVKEEPTGPMPNLEEKDWVVQLRRQGFDSEAVLGGTTRDAGFDTARLGEKGLFENVAFVTIVLPDSRLVKVPIALVADRVEPITIRSTGDDVSAFRFRKDGWVQDVNVSYMVQTNFFREIKEFVQAGQRGQALSRAREGLTRSHDDRKRLNEERDELVKEAAKVPEASRPNLPVLLAASDLQLKKVKEGEHELQVFKDSLEKINHEENDPVRKELLAKLQGVQLLESQAELGKAIDLVKDLIAKGLNDQAVKDKLAQLEKLWKTDGSPEHEKARAFIYNVWANPLSATDLGDKLEMARNALTVCKQKGDLVGPKKLLDGTIAHGPRLKKELDKLDSVNPEDQEQIKAIQGIARGLDRLLQDADGYLGGKTGEKDKK